MTSGLSVAMLILLDLASLNCPDFKVIEGVRTQERQKELVAQGVSWTTESKHLTGNAIDFIPIPFKGWDDIEGFTEIGECIKQLSPDVVWGGDWKVRDYVHVEITGD